MTEESFLRAVGDRPADNLPRMVYADWLEERGDGPRAEFIRVQCELAEPALTGDRRVLLRTRERALLDGHRREWIAALGTPVVDTRFERGMVAAARLPKWESFAEPHFAAVTELDLSGAGLGDAGVRSFAERANFPALKKLMLNGNEITNAGAAALANAKGLPALETLYLFDNEIDDAGKAALKNSKAFTLANLDLGQPAEGYEFTPGQTDAARRELIRNHLALAVAGFFLKHELLQSALFCVAQYWCDEANDAVHGNLILSELPEPMLVGAKTEYDDEDEDEAPSVDPNVTTTVIEGEYSRKGGSVVSAWGLLPWNSNGGAIPLWAAFSSEAGHQEYSHISEVYSPAVMFYRHGGYDILPMQRPQLDGILSEWRSGN